MPHVVREVIDEARGRHSAFDISRHPNRVVLQFLSGYVRELQGKIAKIDPDAARTEELFALPLVDHEAGIALPENRLVVEVGTRGTNGRDYPVQLVPASHRNDVRTPHAAAWQVGSTLFLMSPASVWQNMDEIAVALVATPVALAALADEIELPDTARQALVEKTAAFMARRLPMDPKAPTVDVAMFAEIAREAEENFLLDILNNLSGKTFLTRDVYRPNTGL